MTRSALIFALLALTSPGWAEEGAARPGAAIYAKLCAECHGKNGEGVADKYDEPLHGNRSVENLAKRIARTMPEENVGACVGADAEAVAAYIYDAFYSPQAYARLRPPEFDLARLTIAQYRNSVADLVGRFRGGFAWPRSTTHGLKARYEGFIPLPPRDPNAPPEPKLDEKERNKKREAEKVKFERTDARVEFAFGAASPDPEKMRGEEFSMRWEGSFFAEETGMYEFVVRSENGVRLFVNDPRKVFIDGWVSGSGEVKDLKKSLYLIGGRAYPIVLEYFKFKEKSASVALLWKPPHGQLEVIPEDHFWPDQTRETYVAKTAFPADDRSVGYERGTGVSKEWDQATTEAALDVAEFVEDHMDEFAALKKDIVGEERVAKLKQLARKFTEAAFRRPLSNEDYQHIIERLFASAKTPELAVKRAVLYALKSPRFLYPEVPTNETPDDYDIANRLALALWDSLPDPRLLQMAQQKKLHQRNEIQDAVAKMIPDPRTKAKLRGFFHHWLELERAESIAKDPQAFPSFDAAVLADLRTSLELFLEQVVWSEKSDYRELLQAPYLMLNKRLGKLYERTVVGDGFERVDFDPAQRSGVVTHPYLLAAFAYSKQTSPIHRGVFLTRTIVGMTLRPPPNAVAFEDAKFEQHLTMREKITELTKNTNCMGCHATINPLGFSLENYDAIGRWRTMENDKPINAKGEFSTDEGVTVKLTGARDLTQFAAANPSGHRAFVHHLFQHTVKQAVGICGPDALEEFRQSFVASGFNIRKLLAEIAVADAMRGLPEPPKIAQQTSAP